MSSVRPDPEKPSPARLSSFSDCVISIIITIMVLELKVPHEASLGAVLTLWPVLLSYALSYLIISLIWINHHHLVHHIHHVAPLILWLNLLLLFFVSLIPFTTEYVGVTHMARLPTVLYASNFLLVAMAFLLFESQVALQIDPRDIATVRSRKRARKRNWFTFWFYVLAVATAYVHPAVTLFILLLNALLYVVPEAFAPKDAAS